ncbi:MAG: phage tail tube protein [Clostridiaceae bacterium]
MDIQGKNIISGTYGTLWWDGEKILEIDAFEARVKIEREGVSFAGDLSEDSKIKGLKGEGKLKLKHVFSRGVKKLLKAYQKGEDPRSQLIGKLQDPDAVGKQSERVVINNVWFNELTLMEFENGKNGSKEYPFGYTPSDVDYPDEIKVI